MTTDEQEFYTDWRSARNLYTSPYTMPPGARGSGGVNIPGMGTSGYNPQTNQWAFNPYASAGEKGIMNQSQRLIQGILPQINRGMSPTALARYKQSFMSPQIAALNQSYKKALGQGVNAANSSGMLNSVGFENYRANQLDKNRAQGLADIKANAELASYDLQRNNQNMLMGAYNTYSNALGGQYDRENSRFGNLMSAQSPGQNVFQNMFQQYGPGNFPFPQYKPPPRVNKKGFLQSL